MAQIKSIYDAIIKYQKKENQCTNLLVWLLEKLPSKTLLELCKISGLSINEVRNEFNICVQYPLKNSYPDALIEFADGKYLIIETKLFPNDFEKDQFINHFNGGKNEFGDENVWLLFLSGDEKIPDELDNLMKRHSGRIGFISWKYLLQLLKDSKDSLGEKHEIIITEFLTFANHYKLGRLISMNREELTKFIEAYPVTEKYKEAAEQNFLKNLNEITKHIILASEELAEENEEEIQEKLPCLYKCIKIRGWHTNYSAYVFVNILFSKVGIVLTGYESEKRDKSKLLQLWDENYKFKYKNDIDLFSFTWIDKGEDDCAINGGYFKLVKETNGKLFNPDKISEFADCFYWGYVYNMEVEKIEAYPETIAKDFKKLLDTFVKNNDNINPKATKKRR